MVALHCVTCVGCTAYSLASCETVLSPTRASNPTLALKAELCRLRFAFISLLFLIYSRPAKVHLNQWSSFWGPPHAATVSTGAKLQASETGTSQIITSHIQISDPTLNRNPN